MSPYTGKWLLPVRDISRNSSHTQKQRAVRLGRPGYWNSILWLECLKKWSRRCAYCGAWAESQDHFIPLCVTDSPGTVPWNIVPACTNCNQDKNNDDPWDWMFNKKNVKKGIDKRWGTIVSYLQAAKGRYVTHKTHGR